MGETVDAWTYAVAERLVEKLRMVPASWLRDGSWGRSFRTPEGRVWMRLTDEGSRIALSVVDDDRPEAPARAVLVLGDGGGTVDVRVTACVFPVEPVVLRAEIDRLDAATDGMLRRGIAADRDRGSGEARLLAMLLGDVPIVVHREFPPAPRDMPDARDRRVP